ncbi:MAG: right-handed parallel beta-helix repeat-containing protein [Devosia nanyangense]|uniref:Right-handed parallel beta-helix repeat-containing protein n=1 Tax=Devosia nanyangense TaxID=1228055 RepID=A0A933KZT3_9HYPH|nr:right-handed parallel beta-helix repeat-containing protein [Devosia nanyangense]
MRVSTFFAVLATLFTCAILSVVPANAQASRTWVSGVGDDANPCSRTAPCKTFAGAISKTAVLGEINCLDPGGFGSVTITKSITIDCHEVFASTLNAGTNGVIINFNSFTDARKTVRIRNINFNGFDTGLIGIRILGAAGSAGSEVFIEDVLIDGNFGGTARGISDERTGGGELSISDTTVRNTGATGIAITGGARVDVAIDNVRVQNSNFGVAVGNGAKVMINRSVFSGNTLGGIEADPGGEINVDNSVISSNGTGVTNSGTIRLANTDISFNATGITGATLSFGNNRISGNTAPGTAPTLIGAVSNPTGQQ